MALAHDTLKSEAIAYNVTIEYYLPPYVTYVSENAPYSDDVVKVTGTRYEVSKNFRIRSCVFISFQVDPWPSGSGR